MSLKGRGGARPVEARRRERSVGEGEPRCQALPPACAKQPITAQTFWRVNVRLYQRRKDKDIRLILTNRMPSLGGRAAWRCGCGVGRPRLARVCSVEGWLVELT